jgi:hypothetical protein
MMEYDAVDLVLSAHQAMQSNMTMIVLDEVFTKLDAHQQAVQAARDDLLQALLGGYDASAAGPASPARARRVGPAPRSSGPRRPAIPATSPPAPQKAAPGRSLGEAAAELRGVMAAALYDGLTQRLGFPGAYPAIFRRFIGVRPQLAVLLTGGQLSSEPALLQGADALLAVLGESIADYIPLMTGLLRALYGLDPKRPKTTTGS